MRGARGRPAPIRSARRLTTCGVPAPRSKKTDVPITRIAAEAGLSRQGVYDLLAGLKTLLGLLLGALLAMRRGCRRRVRSVPGGGSPGGQTIPSSGSPGSTSSAPTNLTSVSIPTLPATSPPASGSARRWRRTAAGRSRQLQPVEVERWPRRANVVAFTLHQRGCE